MTNNDELALKMKAAANQRIDADSWDSIDGRIERIGRYKDTAETLSPANILALLAERDADKKRIAELEARTVSVPTFEEYQPDIARELQGAFRIACAAAGIKLEVGE